MIAWFPYSHRICYSGRLVGCEPVYLLGEHGAIVSSLSTLRLHGDREGDGDVDLGHVGIALGVVDLDD